MRVEQRSDGRGSLKWIQRAVNARSPSAIDKLLLPSLGKARSIFWLSPLAGDQYAEYRDGHFLEKIGTGHLKDALSGFWPARGPQWDALARSDAGDVLLVEAKAHIAELCSPGSAARRASRRKIESALDKTRQALGAETRAPWIDLFYQLTNRIAHLYFLREHGVKAWLVLAKFVGDTEMNGPSSSAEWEAAYDIVWHVLGVPKRHRLSRYIVHVYPRVG